MRVRHISSYMPQRLFIRSVCDSGFFFFGGVAPPHPDEPGFSNDELSPSIEAWSSVGRSSADQRKGYEYIIFSGSRDPPFWKQAGEIDFSM